LRSVDAEARAAQPQAALETVDGALERCATHHEGLCKPELLRIKAETFAQDPASAASQAERLLRDSIACARAQGALAWELRSARSLARLMRRWSDRAASRAVLAPVVARFHEGLGMMAQPSAR
jgi:predicted ATPase